MKEQAPEGSHFDPAFSMGKMYHACYFREEYFEALELLKGIVVRSSYVEVKAMIRDPHYFSRKNITCTLPRLR